MWVEFLQDALRLNFYCCIDIDEQLFGFSMLIFFKRSKNRCNGVLETRIAKENGFFQNI